MFANLFEHETVPGGYSVRQKLNAIWDAVPATGTCAKIETEFTKRAMGHGFSAEQCEYFLIGNDA